MPLQCPAWAGRRMTLPVWLEKTILQAVPPGGGGPFVAALFATAKGKMSCEVSMLRQDVNVTIFQNKTTNQNPGPRHLIKQQTKTALRGGWRWRSDSNIFMPNKRKHS
jgi:hypothetical protein